MARIPAVDDTSRGFAVFRIVRVQPVWDSASRGP